MKTKFKLIALVLISTLHSQLATSFAQGTDFTHEGQLLDGTVGATGLYDFQFTIYAVASGGSGIAGPIATNSVGVTNGLFSVVLDFGNGVFTGSDRWLEIDVRPTGGSAYTILTPRQKFTATPYAIYAGLASSANGVAASSVGAPQLATPGSPSPGQVLAYSGTGLTWANADIWSLLNNNAYYLGGNVGIGSSTPVGKLEVVGQDALRPVGYQPFLTLLDDNAGYARGRIQSVAGGLTLATESSLNGSNPSSYITLNDTGNVGIGSATPQAKLEVVGQDALRLVGYQPFLTLLDNNAGYARGRIQSVAGGLRLATESNVNGSNPSSYIALNDTGNVGIGSATPQAKLEVVGQDALRLVGYQPFLTLLDDNSGYARGRIQDVGGEILLQPESYVNGGDPSTYVQIANTGDVSVRTLTIRGGADLAEPFQMSQPDIPQGAVVVIDSENPGRLNLSSKPYDPRVAGIVSGANGIRPGVSLQQEGKLDGGQNVALSGRVYVLADDTSGPIKPGDLLTTSSIPGHAMKVTDHARAQGAILGKAMGALNEGKGLVLVLVSLQ